MEINLSSIKFYTVHNLKLRSKLKIPLQFHSFEHLWVFIPTLCRPYKKNRKLETDNFFFFFSKNSNNHPRWKFVPNWNTCKGNNEEFFVFALAFFICFCCCCDRINWLHGRNHMFVLVDIVCTVNTRSIVFLFLLTYKTYHRLFIHTHEQLYTRSAHT